MTTHAPSPASPASPSTNAPVAVVLHVGALAMGLYSVHAGWLTLPQVCLTLMVELVLVAHFAARRTVRSEGVITRDRMGTNTKIRSVSLTKGTRLSRSDRSFHALMMQAGMTFVAVGVTWRAAPELDLDVLNALSTLGWAGWTLWMLTSETLAYRAWVRSGVARTADPGSHFSVPFARVATYLVLLTVLQYNDLLEHTTGALLVLLVGDTLARVLIGWLNVPTSEEEALTRADVDTGRGAGHRRRPGAASLPPWARRFIDRDAQE